MRRAGAVLVVASVGLVLATAGCTDDGPRPAASSDPASRGTAGARQGPAPAELSAQVLTAAAEQETAPAVASGSLTFTTGATLRIDVLSLTRVPSGTLLTMRWSGAGSLAPGAFRDARYSGIYSARTLYLVDATVSRSRYLPLQFQDYREMCVCPYFPLQLGPGPQTVTALFPALPSQVTSVDIVANEGGSVPRVPVTGPSR